MREGTLLGRKASPPESWAGHYGWNFSILSGTRFPILKKMKLKDRDIFLFFGQNWTQIGENSFYNYF